MSITTKKKRQDQDVELDLLSNSNNNNKKKSTTPQMIVDDGFGQSISLSDFKPAPAIDVSTGKPKRKRKEKDPAFERYEEVSSSKSDGRRVLEAQWNSAFYYKSVPGDTIINQPVRPFRDGAVIVIADEIQTLKGFGSTWNSMPTDRKNYKLTHFEHFMQGMRRSAENILQNSRSTLIYGFLLDKRRYVPISKGIEQTKRNANIDSNSNDEDLEKARVVPPEDGISFKERRPYIYPGQSIPTDWNLAKFDRADTLQDIIRQMCISFCILTEDDTDIDLTYGFDIPPEKRVFVDGHNLCLQDVVELSCIYPFREHAMSFKRMRNHILADRSLWKQCGFSSDEDVYDTPICFENTIDTQGNRYYAIYFLPHLRNQIGEADFTMFTLYKLVSKMMLQEDPSIHHSPFLPVDFLSIDTDIIYLALLFMDKIRKIYCETIPEIWVRYWPQLSWSFCRGTPDPEACKWAHINNLYDWIEIKGKFPPGLYPEVDQKKGEGDEAEESNDIIERVTKKKRKDDNNNNNNNNKEDKNKKGKKDINNSAITTAADGKKEKPKTPVKRIQMTLDESALKKYSYEFSTFIKNRSWAVIVTLLAGGGDYTVRYSRVTHEKLFLALKQNAKYIGELVKWESNGKIGGGHYVVCGESYVRLIKCAYMLTRSQLAMIDPKTITWDRVYDTTKHLSIEYRAPTIYQIKNRFLHLSHYVSMISQLGQSYIHESRPFEVFAFERLNPEKEWASDNILRVTNGIIQD